MINRFEYEGLFLKLLFQELGLWISACHVRPSIYSTYLCFCPLFFPFPTAQIIIIDFIFWFFVLSPLKIYIAPKICLWMFFSLTSLPRPYNHSYSIKLQPLCRLNKSILLISAPHISLLPCPGTFYILLSHQQLKLRNTQNWDLSFPPCLGPSSSSKSSRVETSKSCLPPASPAPRP